MACGDNSAATGASAGVVRSIRELNRARRSEADLEIRPLPDAHSLYPKDFRNSDLGEFRAIWLVSLNRTRADAPRGKAVNPNGGPPSRALVGSRFQKP